MNLHNYLQGGLYRVWSEEFQCQGEKVSFKEKTRFFHQEYVEKGKVGVVGAGGGAAPPHLDKAELAFKVFDVFNVFGLG